MVHHRVVGEGGLARGIMDPCSRNWLLARETYPLLGRKELELMWEVEICRLDIAGLTSTHSVSSGTKVLDKGQSISYLEVAQGERCQAGVGILTSPQLVATQLEFFPVDDRD